MKAVLLALVLSTAATLASARTLVTGNDFLRDAQNLERLDREGEAALSQMDMIGIYGMLGVVKGISDMNSMLAALAKADGVVFTRLACVPEMATTGQLVRVLKAQLERMPERLHLPFPILAQSVLLNAYPCNP